MREPAEHVRRLKSHASEHSAELSAINWEGAVWSDRRWHYLQGADLFCLPTFSENFGIVVLEALQVGTPVMTTHTTPWQFISTWNAGTVVAPDVDALATALRSWGREGRSASERHALAARTHETFDLDMLGHRYIEIYHSVTMLQNPTRLSNG